MKKHRTTTIIALSAAANGWKPGTPLPQELCVFPWGEHKTQKGTFVCNEITLASLPGNNKSRRFDRVALDFNHETMTGREPVKIAAMGTPEVRQGQGIFLTNLEWTATGKEFAENYPALSAGIKTNARGEIIFLHSAALCRQGEVEGVTLLSAALPPFDEDGDRTEDNPPTINPETDTLMDLRDKLCKKYNINTEGKTPEQIDEAILTAMGGADDMTGLSAAVTTALQPLQAQLTALSAELTTLRTKTEADERQQLLDEATSKGIYIPLSAERQKTVDLETLRDLITNSEPGIVPLSAERRTEKQTKPAATALSEEVAGIFGLSADDLKNFAA